MNVVTLSPLSLLCYHPSPENIISSSNLRPFCFYSRPKDKSLLQRNWSFYLKCDLKVQEESEKVGLKLNIQKTKIMASGPITSWKSIGKQWKQWLTLFWGAPKSLQMVPAAMKLKDAYSLEGKL